MQVIKTQIVLEKLHGLHFYKTYILSTSKNTNFKITHVLLLKPIIKQYRQTNYALTSRLRYFLGRQLHLIQS